MKTVSEQVTLQLSDRIVHHATRIAAQEQRGIEEVLTEWLEWAVTERPVDTLPDEEVLALTESQLPAEQQETLSSLLARNQDDVLAAEERQQLDALIHLYEQGLLRKAQALRVAVQRGLREPLQP